MFLKSISLNETGVMSVTGDNGDGECSFKTDSPHQGLSNMFDRVSNRVCTWLMPEANSFALEGLALAQDPKTGIHTCVIKYQFTTKRHVSRTQYGKMKDVVLLEQYPADELLKGEHDIEAARCNAFNEVITAIGQLSNWADENWLHIEHRVTNQMELQFID